MKNKLLAWLSAPYILWMALFVVAPLVVVVIYACTTADWDLTLQNFTGMFNYVTVFGRSFLLAAIATLVCILAGYPAAYLLARSRPGFRRIANMLIMLPMWMNFLLRTYSWMFLLERNGLVNTVLRNLGVFSLINGVNEGLNGLLGTALPTDVAYFGFLGSYGTVILGMVYNFLPFMILPIFSVIEKIDPKVIEAAQDLGANSRQVFSKVIFPLSLPGVLSGVTMVFIPSVSTFVISRLLGGGKTTLLGDLIEMQFTGSAYDPHVGSAVSLVMMVIVLVCMGIMNRFGEGESEAVLL
ncbi:ABC transporter permease [Pseudoflavonifractor phocaeensis]|uniref:ABC transporter permease n=1 Tax=Pseudoflavonifractor phocaeensis TaxID=1870988 RepID=UPI00195BC495|nr:ABC transporter permease [Pseudoflavonifractor phocaeensis]MBM6871062.1 ABC transporter permease [Pseudoflavonifractor phocaeensis]MBM6937211.1 ABC transporter permease [Pseudoflavonifractor phocaeensis]